MDREEKEKQEKKIYELIYHDDLTGIYNRRYFKEQLDKDLQLISSGMKQYSMIMFDIDHFKSINDTYTHDEGDRTLKRVSVMLREIVRDKGVSIRYAGDEFVILLPGISKSHAIELALNMKTLIRDTSFPLSSGAGTLRITLSLGVSNYPEDTQNLFDLLHLADEAAYISKKKGRDRVSTIDEKKAEEISLRFLHRYFSCKKFVGRENLLSELRLLTLPSPGKINPLVAIEGPTGIGKSRVLEEISQSLDPQRYFNLRCYSHPSTLAQPFWEITNTLNRILEENDELASDISIRLEKIKIRELVPLIPKLSKYYVQDSALGELTAQQKRDLLLEALEEILIFLNSHKPLVISIDDFHWSNLGTQMVLEKLKANPGGYGIPVLVAINEEIVLSRKETDFLQYLENLEQKGVLRRHILKPLDMEEIERMVITILPDLEVFKDLKEIIKRKSRGYPLFVEEIIKLLIYKNIIKTEDGRLMVASYDTAIIPENLKDLVSPAVQVLDDEVRDLLCKASVMGEKFNLDMLKKFDGRNEAYVQDLIEKAEKAALISSDPQNETFTFSSDGARDSLYESLEDGERKSHHKKLAELESSLNVEEIETALSRIAYHFKESGEIAQSQHYFNELLRNYESFMAPRVIEFYAGQASTEKDWVEEQELSRADEAVALRIIKLLQVTMENIKQFPYDSEIVKGSFESCYVELKRLFKNTKSISLADGDGVVLINGRAPTTSGKDGAAVNEEKFLEILKSAGLKGITMKKDISREHFLLFLKMMIVDTQDEIRKQGGWTKILKDKGISTIITNERIYVAMAERDLFDSKRLKDEQIAVRRTDEKDVKAFAVAEQKESPGSVRSLEDGISRIKSMILSSQEWGEDVEKISTLLDKIFGRRQVLEDFLNTINAEQQQKKQDDPAGRGETKMSDLGKQIPGEILKAYRAIDLMTIAKLRLTPDVIVRDLESKDDDVAGSSAAALTHKASEAIPYIINYLESTESLLGRKRALHVLKRIAPEADRILLEELMGNTRGEEKKRIIEILHDFADIDITDAVSYFLRSPQNDTREAIIKLVSLRPTERIINILLDILNDKLVEDNAQIIIDAIHALGKMKVRSAVPSLKHLITKKNIFVQEVDDGLQEAACLALGKIGDSAAIPDLLEAIRLSSPILMRRNKSPKVRATAAYALSHFATAEVRSILSRALSDPSPDVRSSANLALYNLDKSLPGRNGKLLGDDNGTGITE